MTLSRRMAWNFAALMLSLVLLCGAALWGLRGLASKVHQTGDEYDELRQVESIRLHIASANSLLQSRHPESERASKELATSLDLIKKYLGYQDGQEDTDAADQEREEDAIHQVQTSVIEVAKQLQSHGPVPLTPEDAEPLADGLSRALDAISGLSSDSDKFVSGLQRESTARSQRAVAMLGVISAAILATTAAFNIWQYRSVVRPLGRLRQGVRTLASGRFDERLAESGDREFNELSRDFNRMAAELSALYHNLEEKVNQKSKELVRSERLASVGYLATGVAHEINNPLSIILGHAELLLKKNPDSPERATPVRPALEIMRDEALRCKSITGKLLSLGRNGGDQREPVALRAIAENVVTIVSGLPMCRGRQVTLSVPDRDPLLLWGNPDELRQVLLNLLINALDATPPQGGIVLLSGQRIGDRIEFVVADSGKGMSPHTLERVFEPFFSERRGGEPGTGLGLSITHAIVQSHQGSIHADSAGIGRGSCFTIRLPAYPEAKSRHEGRDQTEQAA